MKVFVDDAPNNRNAAATIRVLSVLSVLFCTSLVCFCYLDTGSVVGTVKQVPLLRRIQQSTTTEEDSSFSIVEGDIIVPSSSLSSSSQQKSPTIGDHSTATRSLASVPFGRQLWTNDNRNGYFYITVRIDANFSNYLKEMIVKGLRNLQWRSQVIRFDVIYNQPQRSIPYIHYVNSDLGCRSMLGQTDQAFEGDGQYIHLQESACGNIRTVQHEMMHALGFGHEQSRPDRNDYIEILWDNIIDEYKKQFWKINTVDSLGTEYDLESIMHYEPHAFSKNDQPTIRPRNGGEIAHRDTASCLFTNVGDIIMKLHTFQVWTFPNLKSVEFHDDITDIGEEAFFRSGIEGKVVIPNKVTKVLHGTSSYLLYLLSFLVEKQLKISNLIQNRTDILQIRLMYQCKSGPRYLIDYEANKCTPDCQCWHKEPGCGNDNARCTDDMVCSDNVCTEPNKNNSLPSFTSLVMSNAQGQFQFVSGVMFDIQPKYDPIIIRNLYYQGINGDVQVDIFTKEWTHFKWSESPNKWTKIGSALLEQSASDEPQLFPNGSFDPITVNEWSRTGFYIQAKNCGTDCNKLRVWQGENYAVSKKPFVENHSARILTGCALKPYFDNSGQHCKNERGGESMTFWGGIMYTIVD